jgi:uncharacterized membrane protein HdeD (DUF308 family)
MLTADNYWGLNLVRGLLALAAGLCMAFVPSAINSMILVPLALAFSLACLGLYGSLDSVLLMSTSLILPIQDRARWFIGLQGIVGLGLCGLFFWLPGISEALELTAMAAALQAICVAATDLTLGASMRSRHGEIWINVSAAISILSGITLVLCRNLGAADLARIISAYLLTLALNFILLAFWMLSHARGAAKRKLHCSVVSEVHSLSPGAPVSGGDHAARA